MQPSVPEHSAVLVIDVQRGLFCASPAPFEADAVIERINGITAKARKAGVPVFFVQHDGQEAENLVPFTEGWKLHPGLQVERGDLMVRKTTCDAFYGTSLEEDLSSRGVQVLLLMGYATDFCVDSTLRNALSKDFRIMVVADAHTTNDNPVLKAELIRQHHNWAWVNCTSPSGVTALKASEVAFAARREAA